MVDFVEVSPRRVCKYCWLHCLPIGRAEGPLFRCEILSVVGSLAQAELTGREVSLHNQKLALESMVKELQDTKQTIDRFRCE